MIRPSVAGRRSSVEVNRFSGIHCSEALHPSMAEQYYFARLPLEHFHSEPERLPHRRELHNRRPAARTIRRWSALRDADDKRQRLFAAPA